MKMNGALMIVLALLIGIVPQFADCLSQGSQLTLENGRQIPMKCHWTARAEMGLALPLLATGILLVVFRRRDAQRILSLIGALLGVTAILLPTTLIGVCANPSMLCKSFMQPFLILTGSLVIVVGLLGVVQTFWARSMQLQKEAA